MRSSFVGKFGRILIFGLWSLGALRSQALPIDDFAHQCLEKDDPDANIKEVRLQKFPIGGTSTAIYFVKTDKGPEYVVKVIDLKNFSPNHLDDFRGAQLIYQRLQGKALPPNVQIAFPHYCQIMGQEQIFGIADEFLPPSTGRLMLWTPKVSGDRVDDMSLEKVENEEDQVCFWIPETRRQPGEGRWKNIVKKKTVNVFAQSIAQADTFLYQNDLGLGNALVSPGLVFDFQTMTLAIVNTAGVRSINRDDPFPKYKMIGTWRLTNMLMPFPDLLCAAINFYEILDPKECFVRTVKRVIADRFESAVTTRDHCLPLDQVIALIDQYRGMDLMPDRIDIPARLLFYPTLLEEEFVRILLTNLPDEYKAALRTMHEQQISKAEVQRGNADPQICEAFQHYLSRIFGMHRVVGCYSENPANDYDRSVGEVIQFDSSADGQKILESYYANVDPGRKISWADQEVKKFVFK
ncbi:MAG: hypothetical protein LBJ78_01850 [Puniceicoccales bacterium]|jgi:hypothetical protein|nr:hypothetical protein [Puniceicoccales bacterium]